MTAAREISKRVQLINTCLKQTFNRFGRNQPDAFDNILPVNAIIDRSGQLGPGRRYVRWSYQYGILGHITCIVADGEAPYVMSVLVEEDGRIINPCFHEIKNNSDFEMYNHTKDLLDMLVERTERYYDGLCRISGES